VSSGGYFLIFWQFQNPGDLLFSVIKGMVDGDRDRAGGLLLRLQRQRRAPSAWATATAKSMVLNLVSVTLIGMLGTQVFWGANPRAPIGG